MITAAYLPLVSIKFIYPKTNTNAALPKKTSWTLVPVTLATTTENRITKSAVTVAMMGLLIGIKKRRNTGMRRMITAMDTSRMLARILSLACEYRWTASSSVFRRVSISCCKKLLGMSAVYSFHASTHRSHADDVRSSIP